MKRWRKTITKTKHKNELSSNRYILPEKAMTASALRVTGLRVEGDTLLHHGR